MELYEKPIYHVASLPFFPLSNHPPSTTLKCSNLKAEPALNHLIKMLKKFKVQCILHIKMKKKENTIFSRFLTRHH